MIDMIAVLAILAVVGLGSRYLSEDKDKDTHNLFCIGMCTHIDEHTEEELDPNEPDQ